MKWEENEIEFLKKNLDKGTDFLSKNLNRNKRSILRKLESLGMLIEYRSNNKFYGRYYDEEKENIRRKKISETCKINKKNGGLRKGSGRGKKGTYKGFWCDSSYELAWVIYHLDHKINFQRNFEKFPYFYKDSEKREYIPDFIKDGIYYEIKGYKNDTLEWKYKYFPHPLRVLFKEDLGCIFDYVINVYGKNFISLYEEKTYKGCNICRGYIHKSNKSGICKNCISKIKKTENKKEKSNRIKNIRKCQCGKIVLNRSKMCEDCYHISRRRVNRPILDVLISEVNDLGYCKVGRKYGVSDNTIRKWIRSKIRTK